MAWQYYLPIFSVLHLLIAGGASDSRRGFSSPVRELHPSLAASVAGGTIIAARSHLPRQQTSKSRTNGEEANSPVDDLEDVEEEECLVILFRSPIACSESGSAMTKQRIAGNLTFSSVFGVGTTQDKAGHFFNISDRIDNNRYHGLSFLTDGPVNFSFLPSNSGSSSNLRILHAPTGLLVAATGFAPDVDHILDVVAGRVLSRISVFDGGTSTSSPMTSSYSSKSVDPHRLLREDISTMMIDAAMSDGGRPWGVQLLVIGQSALFHPQQRQTMYNNNNRHQTLEMYTVDPSGGWRSCVRSGAAVGRGAERVRSCLWQKMKHGNSGSEKTLLPSSTDVSRGWMGALDRAMMASIVGLDQGDDDPSSNDNDMANGSGDNMSANNYGAVVIFGAAPLGSSRTTLGTSRCAMVDSVITEDSYNRCRRKLMDQRILVE